jgi:hypothetical protein
MTPATFQLALPVTKLPQAYALDARPAELPTVELQGWKWETGWGEFDSETNIAIEQMKSISVH